MSMQLELYSLFLDGLIGYLHKTIRNLDGPILSILTRFPLQYSAAKVPQNTATYN